MKKIIIFYFTFLFIFLFGIGNVNALGFELSSADATINDNENVTISGAITNTSWPTGYGIKKIEGELSFNTNYLSSVSVTTSSSGVFTVTSSNVSAGKVSITIEASSTNGILADSVLFSLVLKGTSPTTGTNVSYKINAGGLTDKDGNKPASEYPATVINSNNLAVVVSKVSSTNNNLKTLTLKDSEGETISYTPVFAAATTSYEATVEYAVNEVTVSATAADSASTIAGTGTVALTEVGEKTVTLTVTSESGATKSYTLVITRSPSNSDKAKLKSMVIEDFDDFEFSKDKTVYVLYITKPIKILNINTETVDPGAKTEISNNENLKDGSVIHITVTSKDKEDTITYYIKVKSKNATTTKKASSSTYNRNPYIIIGLSVISFGLLGALIYVIKKED